MLRLDFLFLLLLPTVSLKSCSETQFTGQGSRGALTLEPALDVSENQDRTENPRPGGSNPDGSDPEDMTAMLRREVMTFRCDGERDASIGEIAFSGPASERIHAQVRGEFCPSATQKLNVLFLVDFSASMGRWRKTSTDRWVQGNDLQSADTCGRLKAAQAVISKLSTNLEDRVQIASIAFAGDVVEKYSDKSWQTPESFELGMTADRFCRFVAQSGDAEAQASGSIPPSRGFAGLGKLDGHTNYEAAFNKASSLLSGVDGRTVVYFISDGAPTLPTENTINASAAAGEAMRKTSGNITVNALMLGNENKSAEDVLKKVTGANRILYARDAEQLDQKILSFPEPTINESTLAARVEVSPYPSRELGILHVARTNKTIWTYHTQPIVLLGEPGHTVDNVVKVTATGQDGSLMTSVITIKYTQK